MNTPEIREAPVPVRGWFWVEDISLKQVVARAECGWNADLIDMKGDKTSPTAIILSNGQAVIVRRKPEKPS